MKPKRAPASRALGRRAHVAATSRRVLCSSRASVDQLSSHVAKAVNTAISSSWAIFAAATVALTLYFFGDRIGLDRQRLDLHFLVDAATFLMVFVIEHTQSREQAALHTKLDAIIRALDADTSTVGIEELSQKEIQDIRDRRRERTPGARARG
jgi:low affinity Fe/Cu permease